ncbi:hypothetical protein SMICM304S_09112 [Streptomyces microflavus]
MCHDSPHDSTASHHTFPERSRDLKGRLPTAWQIELIDHVTWCSSATRTSEPQKKAVAAPHHDIVTRPPTSGGIASETIVKERKWREIPRIAGSLIRSGAYFCCGVCSSSNIHAMCAHHRPFISAGRVSPNRHGECGSPSASENLWCLR